MTLIPEHVNHKDAETLLKHILSKSQNRSVRRVIDILSKEFQDSGELLLALEYISKELNSIQLAKCLLDEPPLSNTPALLPEHVNNIEAQNMLKHLLSKLQIRAINRVIDILSKEFQDSGELLLALEFMAKDLNLIKLSQSLLQERFAATNPDIKNIALHIQGNISNTILVVGSKENMLYLDANGNPAPNPNPIPPTINEKK